MFQALSCRILYLSIWSVDIYVFINWFACFPLQDVRLILKALCFKKKKDLTNARHGGQLTLKILEFLRRILSTCEELS